MKLSTWLIGLSAATLAFSAHAQNVPAPSSDAPVTRPAPPKVPPAVDGPADPQSRLPDAAVPPAPPYDAGPTPQPVIIEPSPEVAPTPPADYPKCSRTVKDECENSGGK